MAIITKKKKYLFTNRSSSFTNIPQGKTVCWSHLTSASGLYKLNGHCAKLFDGMPDTLAGIRVDCHAGTGTFGISSQFLVTGTQVGSQSTQLVWFTGRKNMVFKLALKYFKLLCPTYSLYDYFQDSNQASNPLNMKFSSLS